MLGPAVVFIRTNHQFSFRTQSLTEKCKCKFQYQIKCLVKKTVKELHYTCIILDVILVCVIEMIEIQLMKTEENIQGHIYKTSLKYTDNISHKFQDVFLLGHN